MPPQPRQPPITPTSTPANPDPQPPYPHWQTQTHHNPFCLQPCRRPTTPETYGHRTPKPMATEQPPTHNHLHKLGCRRSKRAEQREREQREDQKKKRERERVEREDQIKQNKKFIHVATVHVFLHVTVTMYKCGS